MAPDSPTARAAAPDSFGARGQLAVGDRTYEIFRLAALADRFDVARLPYSIKVLLENLLRHEDGIAVRTADIEATARWGERPERHGLGGADNAEIAFTPERVLLQDFTGVPSVVDLAAMRDALAELGGDPSRVDPLVPVDLVIDHSVIVEVSGSADAYDRNVDIEYQRNIERYQVLRWSQHAFDRLRVVPPGTGICHQVNLEYLSQVVFATDDGRAYCDTLVGADSHTTMVNGLGVLGWGVGGIEAEAAMLGQPLSMLLPPVVGFRLTGEQPVGTTATDLVLTITHLLRQHGVVGKFVEFHGPGVAAVPLPNRATIGNMSPEYGATCAIFPVDEITLDYLRFTGRDEDHIALVEAYAKEQGLFHRGDEIEPVYSESIELDLSTVVPSIAGPSRPQDLVPLGRAPETVRRALDRPVRSAPARLESPRVPNGDSPTDVSIEDGHVVVAAITSCTNTSNPEVMVAAGLLASKAAARGLQSKPWVKTSLAPGSRVVMDYLDRANLTQPLAEIGFELVGFGCTTCIGNSGPLLPGVSEAVADGDLSVASVLSGNRNFEGRIHPEVRMNFLASPPLVVAYALAGTMDLDLTTDPLGTDRQGNPVHLADVWPSADEVNATIRDTVSSEMFRRRYAAVFDGDERWRSIETATAHTFAWDPSSTYVLRPSFLEGVTAQPEPISDLAGARVLAVLGDSVTTDHISPAGSIGPSTPGRSLSGRPRCRTGRFQFVRCPSREPRGHGARHLRQRAPAQPVGAGHGGRNHPSSPRRGADDHLRGGDALPGRGSAPRRPRRKGVRDRLLPRLGGQGDPAARGSSRHRRELRADPPLEPDRHGCPAPPVHGRPGRRCPRPDRPRDLQRERSRPAQRGRGPEDGGRGRGRRRPPGRVRSTSAH